MREFFRSWRRKIGCITLAMACAVMLLWARSLYIFDSATLSIGDLRLLFVSGSQKSGLILHKDDAINILVFQQTGGQEIAEIWTFDERRFESQPFHFTPMLASIGKVFYDDRIRKSPIEIMLMPYWVVAIPLTLLSAYLIVWKPRKTPKPGSVTNA